MARNKILVLENEFMSWDKMNHEYFLDYFECTLKLMTYELQHTLIESYNTFFKIYS